MQVSQESNASTSFCCAISSEHPESVSFSRFIKLIIPLLHTRATAVHTVSRRLANDSALRKLRAFEVSSLCGPLELRQVLVS